MFSRHIYSRGFRSVGRYSEIWVLNIMSDLSREYLFKLMTGLPVYHFVYVTKYQAGGISWISVKSGFGLFLFMESCFFRWAMRSKSFLEIAAGLVSVWDIIPLISGEFHWILPGKRPERGLMKILLSPILFIKLKSENI